MNLKVNDGRFNQAKHNALVDAVNAATVKSGAGYTVSRNSGGTVLGIKPGKNLAGSPPHPFKVYMRVKPGTEEEPEYEAKVELNSSLMKSLQPDDRQPISGLDTWFDLIGNDAIWLGVIFSPAGTAGISSASIDSWGQGNSFNVDAGAWTGNDGFVEDNGSTELPKHQVSRVLIAFSVAGDDGEPILTQCCFNHLLIRNICVNGKGARFPMPAPYGPYIIPS